MKRTVSPVLSDGPENCSKKKRLISLFSALKNVFIWPSLKPVLPNLEPVLRPKLQPVQEPLWPSGSEIEPEACVTNEEQLPNSFVSCKRKMSLHGSLKHLSLSVPRSSVSEPLKRSILESLYESEHSHEEEKDMDGQYLHLGSNPEQHLVRELSPSVYVPKTRVLLTDPQGDLDAGESVSDYGEGPQQLVLGQNYSSLYEDDEGNLIRPPFIILDPRERYQILQMKKSMEASEFLQSRLKYMVDPDETTSVVRPNNKVDSCTQTHNKDYLQKSLNFNALRTKLALRSRRQRKLKRGRNVFSGEFYYEPTAVEPPSETDLKFQGVLGSVKKPEFTAKAESRPKKVFPDADARQRSLKRRGSVSERPGLENALRFGKTRETFDEDYVKKLEKTSNIIKLKGQPIESSKTASVGPSAAFKFDIQKDKIDSILDHRRREGESIKLKTDAENGDKSDKSKQTSSGLFELGAGKANDTSAEDNSTFSTKVPTFGTSNSSTAFSFGKKTDASDLFSKKKDEGTTNPKEPTSSFTFGASSQEKQGDLFGEESSLNEPVKPLFSFGESKKAGESANTENTSGHDKDTTEKKTPTFSFGNTVQQSGEKPSTFSFDNSSQKGENKAPALSFGSKPDETGKSPAFSLGTFEKKAKSITPGSSFGGDKKALTQPLLSFGKTDQNKDQTSDASKENSGDKTDEPSKANDKPVSVYSEDSTKQSLFGGEPKAGTKFSFASTLTNCFTFGQKVDLKPSSAGTSASIDMVTESGRKRKTSAFGKNPLFGDSKTESANSTDKASESPAAGNLFGAKPASQPFFGSKPASNTDKDLQILTISSQDSTTSEASKQETGRSGTQALAAPTFSFEKPPASGTEAPKFSFGTLATDAKEKPSSSFGSAGKAKEAETPRATSETKESNNFGLAGVKQPASNPFLFGSKSNPVKFGNHSSSSEATPVLSFPFANPRPAQEAPGTASFNFGQSATADPALIFGAGCNAPAPSFNFSVVAKPANFEAQIAPFGASTQPSVGFNFSSNAVPAFGGSRPTTPANPGFAFGANNQSAASTQASGFGGFNSNTAASSVFGGTSGSVTPNFGGFGQNPAGQFTSGQAQPNGFSFSNNVMSGTALNSATASFGQHSRESTPPAFGNPIAGAAVIPPGTTFNGRKIAHMRARNKRR